jgi:hypothetical protein
MRTLLFCFWLFCYCAATSYSRQSNDFEHSGFLIEVLNTTIVPMVKSYCGPHEKDPSDVVIIEDGKLRAKLAETYMNLNQCLRFNTSKNVVYRKKAYFYKPAKREVYVNTYRVESLDDKTCIVDWTRTITSLAGFSKKVTLSYSNGKWQVTGIELDSVW